MSRISRNNMKDSSFFHIMVQGINKEYVFNTKKNKERYLELIYSNNEDIQIIAYCIMDNHAHILVKTKEIKAIQSWMKKSNTSYAIYYNRINDRVGYVFRERYKSQPIKNEKHLLLGIDYIHNNPVKAQICKQKENYEYSSYSKIYKGNQIEMRKKISEILKQTILSTNYNEEQEEFVLIEDERVNKEEMCKNIINEFLIDRKLNMEALKRENKYLTEIVRILKFKNDISYRLMEKYLEISREKLRRLIT